jgi:hypothetical protein
MWIDIYVMSSGEISTFSVLREKSIMPYMEKFWPVMGMTSLPTAKDK